MRNHDVWVKARDAIDACPWPGPRPLSEDDTAKLVGRNDDLARLVSDVIGHQLVILTGDSGVGKTSALYAGLIPALEHAGFDVLVCRTWSKNGDASGNGIPAWWSSVVSENTDRILARTERNQMTGLLKPQKQKNLVDNLVAHGRDLVVILDQFEELIRYSTDDFDSMSDFLRQLNERRDMRVRVVVSLRVEYEHRLRQLEKQLRPFSFARVYLEPIAQDDSIGAVIASGGEKAITDGAAERLVKEWQLGKGHSLLQLQAALYVAHAHAKQRSRSKVSLADVEALNQRPALGDGSYFERALVQAVEVKIASARKACSAPRAGIDRPLEIGTFHALQSAVPHLASGGFKTPLERYDLCTKTLGDVTRRVTTAIDGVDPARRGRVSRYIFGRLAATADSSHGDLLSVPWWESPERPASGPDLSIAVPASELPTWSDVKPWETERDGVASGMCLGLPPEATLFEEYRRFLFGLDWLEASELVRVTKAGDSTMVSLIHDGFGTALERWSATDPVGPDHWLELLSFRGSGGSGIRWGDELLGRDSPGHDLHVNLRWRAGRVRAHRIRNVVFANCDFRGVLFENCSFEGVVMVNCLLDGAVFSECTFRGSTPAVTRKRDTDKNSVPGFDLTKLFAKDDKNGTPAAFRTAMGRYRPAYGTGPTTGVKVMSRTSGLPVVISTRAKISWKPKPIKWEDHVGGLSVYGGRLSSLMIRGCRFVGTNGAGHGVSLRYVAGTGLDLAEITDGTCISIAHATVRGLTVAPDVENRQDPKIPAPGIDIDAWDSVIGSTWFSEGLRGTVQIDDCQVVDLFNASDPERLTIDVANSWYHGLFAAQVNDVDDRQSSVPFALAEHPESLDELRRYSAGMDYRTNPAQLEYEKAVREET